MVLCYNDQRHSFHEYCQGTAMHVILVRARNIVGGAEGLNVFFLNLKVWGVDIFSDLYVQHFA